MSDSFDQHSAHRPTPSPSGARQDGHSGGSATSRATRSAARNPPRNGVSREGASSGLAETSSFMLQMYQMPQSPTIFDRKLLRARQQRARALGAETFLIDRVAAELGERLAVALAPAAGYPPAILPDRGLPILRAAESNRRPCFPWPPTGRHVPGAIPPCGSTPPSSPRNRRSLARLHLRLGRTPSGARFRYRCPPRRHASTATLAVVCACSDRPHSRLFLASSLLDRKSTRLNSSHLVISY